MSSAAQHLDAARRYIAALECGDDAAAVGRLLHPDVVVREFPNRFAPRGQARVFDELLAGVERGRQLMARQTYDVTNALAVGDSVVLEIAWSGTLAQSLGQALPQGTTLSAHLAVFLEFRDGLIYAQRHYDCYDP
jgi:ketosteroid isomerase-like protein